MKRNALSVAVLIAVAVTAVQGQSGAAMPDDHRMERKAAMDATYVGCLEAGPIAHAFVLTHVTRGEEMTKAMKQDPRKSSGAMAGQGRGMDMTPLPSTVSLHVVPADVSGHVGKKVSLVGALADGRMGPSNQVDAMTRMPVLTVKAVKIIAATCP